MDYRTPGGSDAFDDDMPSTGGKSGFGRENQGSTIMGRTAALDLEEEDD